MISFILKVSFIGDTTSSIGSPQKLAKSTEHFKTKIKNWPVILAPATFVIDPLMWSHPFHPHYLLYQNYVSPLFLLSVWTYQDIPQNYNLKLFNFYIIAIFTVLVFAIGSNSVIKMKSSKTVISRRNYWFQSKLLSTLCWCFFYITFILVSFRKQSQEQIFGINFDLFCCFATLYRLLLSVFYI